jgi:hypothetical protein
MALFCAVSFSSCLTTKTYVGNYQETTGPRYTYSKAKQMWLFWGLIPMGRTHTSTPTNGSCEVITRFTFGDVLLSGITGGIVTSYTIKVKGKKATGGTTTTETIKVEEKRLKQLLAITYSMQQLLKGVKSPVFV